MFKAITHSSVPVTDQDEAKRFYVDTLGLELSADIDLGSMRWLTVHVPGDESRQLLLEKLGPPIVAAEDQSTLNELAAKGALGLGLILQTDDCHRTHAELVKRDVEINDPPTERFYGIDMGIRDPFGNGIRITQPIEGEMELPDGATDLR